MNTEHEETALDANGLIESLADLRNTGRLWMVGYKPDHECDKQPLSDKGLAVVKALVSLCLEHDVAPFCCISLKDWTCSADDIVSLNPAQCDDLVKKATAFIPLH